MQKTAATIDASLEAKEQITPPTADVTIREQFRGPQSDGGSDTALLEASGGLPSR
jgi:hypothetical protein